jgi:hypothetical protein
MPANAGMEAAAPKIRGGNPPGRRTFEHDPGKAAFSIPACSSSLILSCVLIDRMVSFDREAV